MLLDLRLRPKGVLNVGESEVPSFHPLSFPSPNISSGSTNDHQSLPPPPPTVSTSLTSFPNGIEYLTSVRGIGWIYDSRSHLHVPEWGCTSNPRTYVSRSLRSCEAHYMVIGASNTIRMSFPGLKERSGEGKSIFSEGNSVLEMVAVSTGIDYMFRLGCSSSLVRPFRRSSLSLLCLHHTFAFGFRLQAFSISPNSLRP